VAKTFRCTLITPSAKVLDDDVVYASIPAWDGLFGVLADRAPIVAQMGIGELRLDFPGAGAAAGGSRSFVVDDGFVQMVNNKLTILAGKAIPAESISVAEAEAELKAVEAKQVPAEAKDRAAAATRAAREKRFAALKVQTARSRKGI
jgi:F-type H+-transporting ATPase subunit epsilon